MAMTPQQQINTLFLMQIGHMVAEADYAGLMHLGLRRDQIPRLEQISLASMLSMAAKLNGGLVNARIDPNAVEALLSINEREARQRRVEDDLLAAGASQRLMKGLFGINVHQYVLRREVLGCKGRDVGRRPALEPLAECAILQAWRQACRRHFADRDRDLDPDACQIGECYLDAHRQTGASVRDIEKAVASGASGEDGLCAGGGLPAVPSPAELQTNPHKQPL